MDKLVNYSIWTLSHDCFLGFYTNWRVSRENLIYAILVGNQNIFMCKSLLVYISYFILYREFENLVNYSIWTLSHDCFKGFFLNWRVSRDDFIYSIILWNQNIFMCKCKIVNIAYFILYGEYETCLDVKLGFILVKLNVVYERDIVVGIS